ncbi:MAG TPA: hypothetical protein G4O15_02580 [Dehalococcoidia bacterium]|nr:hypothetical protein [Dehalococcoidia bacterium]
MKRILFVLIVTLVVLVSFGTSALALPCRVWVGSASSGFIGDISENPPAGLEVPVEIKPEVINIDSRGVYTAFVTFPEDYLYGEAVEEIAGKTIVLKFQVAGLGVLDAKSGDTITVIVQGTLIDGTTDFWGIDEVKVIVH